MELTKDFVSPITTKPWGKFIPKLADGDKPNQGEINSQRLYTSQKDLILMVNYQLFQKTHLKKEFTTNG